MGQRGRRDIERQTIVSDRERQTYIPTDRPQTVQVNKRYLQHLLIDLELILINIKPNNNKKHRLIKIVENIFLTLRALSFYACYFYLLSLLIHSILYVIKYNVLIHITFLALELLTLYCFTYG